MAVPAHFSNRWQNTQNHERKSTSAKIRAQNSKFYILEISWKLYAGKFLGNYMLGNSCWEISWKLSAGNLLMETMCWEIRMDTSSFLMEVIMARCYGTIPRFQGNGTWSSDEHPSSTDLFRTKRSEASKVIGSVKQGDGDAKPIMAPMGVVLQWVNATVSK